MVGNNFVGFVRSCRIEKSITKSLALLRIIFKVLIFFNWQICCLNIGTFVSRKYSPFIHEKPQSGK